MLQSKSTTSTDLEIPMDHKYPDAWNLTSPKYTVSFGVFPFINVKKNISLHKTFNYEMKIH